MTGVAWRNNNGHDVILLDNQDRLIFKLSKPIFVVYGENMEGNIIVCDD